MKAAVIRRYGPPSVISIEDRPDPIAGPGQVLVAIEAAGVTTGDARIRGARAPGGMGPMIRLAFGITGPRRQVPGREYAGRVIACGSGVAGFTPGTAVFGITDGMQLGAHAEKVVVKAGGMIAPCPDSLDPATAAGFFFGGLTAADFLIDQCALKPAERVLIVGATGAVGSAAVQIARHLGSHVTALAGPGNLELGRDLGAHEVFDYRAGPPPGPFDVILDCPGALPDPLSLLAAGGRLGAVTADLGQMIGATLRPVRSGQKRVQSGVVKETPQAIQRLIAIHAQGGYHPLIGKVLPFDAIVAAHALADSGHKRGNIVLTFGAPPAPLF